MVNMDDIKFPDFARYLSFILVDFKQKNNGKPYTLNPVYLAKLENLYSHLPAGTFVDILDRNPPLCSKAVQKCIQSAL